MKNHQFGSSDTPVYCDSNNMSSSLIVNGDGNSRAAILTGQPENNTKSPSNSISVIALTTSTHACMPDNPEKPPYGSTIEDVECQRPSSKPTSWLHLLHLFAVVVASSTINGVVFGVVNNFGVFYVYLIELFKSDSSLLMLTSTEEQLATSDALQGDNSTSTSTDSAFLQPLIAGVGSLNIGLIFFCSIFASVLSDRYGIRQVCFVGGILSTIGMYASSVSVNLIYLYITYGLVLGIGASLVYAPSLAILGHYFDRRLGLVNGLVTAGSSGFSIVMPIVLRMLINAHGIQTTFKYLTFLMAALILCSLTFKETIPKASKAKSAEAKRHGSRSSLASLFQFEALFKNELYICWLFSIPTGLFGYFVPFCHLVKHAQDINSQYPGEVLVMCIGIFSLIGRLLSGPLADFSHVNRIAMQQIAFISIGVLTMSLTVVRDFSLLLVCCGLGLFDGCFISLLGPIAFDIVGAEYANQAIGLLLCLCSLPLTVGPPIAAYAYGVYGNYTLAFFLAGIPPIVAAILMFNIIRHQRSRSRSFSALNGTVDNVAIRNGFCENGEKLHLLSNGNGVINGTSSPVKLRITENSSSSVTDDTNSEHASLLKPNSNHVIVSTADDQAAQPASVPSA